MTKEAWYKDGLMEFPKGAERSVYHRRPLEAGDQIRLTPGGCIREVIRVTPAAAYVAGEPHEVTIGDKTFTRRGRIVPIARGAFVYPAEDDNRTPNDGIGEGQMTTRADDEPTWVGGHTDTANITEEDTGR